MGLNMPNQSRIASAGGSLNTRALCTLFNSFPCVLLALAACCAQPQVLAHFVVTL
jgi:hypothetical protein